MIRLDVFDGLQMFEIFPDPSKEIYQRIELLGPDDDLVLQLAHVVHSVVSVDRVLQVINGAVQQQDRDPLGVSLL